LEKNVFDASIMFLKWNIKRWILEVNEKFQKIKCAYFLTKIKGKVIYKP
jgi:hypothetical protein